MEAALLIISFLLSLRESRIVRIPGGRRGVIILRPWRIEWRPKTYPFGKIRIGDMVPTKGDEIPGSFSDHTGALDSVDPGVQDERSRVKVAEVMDHGISAHRFKRRAGKICYLAHEQHVR